jgi:hypothetical protein
MTLRRHAPGINERSPEPGAVQGFNRSLMTGRHRFRHGDQASLRCYPQPMLRYPESWKPTAGAGPLGALDLRASNQ